jgi:hypothetical protein
MIRDIDRAVGARIERRRLADFDYGTFEPETQFATRAPAAALPRSFRQPIATAPRPSGALYVSRHRVAPRAHGA